MAYKMPIPKLSRSLETGAAFIEAELDRMRERMRQAEEDLDDAYRSENEVWQGTDKSTPPPARRSAFPMTTSHENDLMTAVEWATSAANLRMLARVEREREETKR